MHHDTRATTPTTPSSQTPFLTTEQFLADLSPRGTSPDHYLDEPCEPFGKLKAVVSLLKDSGNEETGGRLFDNEKVAWTLLLIDDLIEEAEKRAEAYQNHCHNLFWEIEKRLNACNVVLKNNELRCSPATSKEV